MDTQQAPEQQASRRQLFAWSCLFAVMYFAQGFAEPTEGLIAQPVRSLLDGWGHAAGEISTFSAWLAIPWAIKPLYGLISDFVPIRGSRRRNYLLLLSFVTTVALAFLTWFPPQRGEIGRLLGLLLLPTLGIAFMDVVVDALMVQYGQPNGMVGRFQSIQWSASYLATILTGSLGGWLSQHGKSNWGFAICAAASATVLVTTWLFVEEPRGITQGRSLDMRNSIRDSLHQLARTRSIWLAVAFLMLWNFNPFCSPVLQAYMVKHLGLSEQFYGHTVSLMAVGAVIGSVAYGIYCRWTSQRVLLHLSIVLGIATCVAYFAMRDEWTAGAISVAVGFAYVTGTLVQMDLAARLCPPEMAATVFAMLMSATNISASLGIWAGGHLYESLTARYGAVTAFQLLILVGALTTAACWFLVPALQRRVKQQGMHQE